MGVRREDVSHPTADELVRRAGPDALKRWLSGSQGEHAEPAVDELAVDDLTQRRAVQLLQNANAASTLGTSRPADAPITRRKAAALLGMDPRTFDRRVRPHIPDHGLGGPPKFKTTEVLSYAVAAAANPSANSVGPKPRKRTRRPRRIRRRRWSVLGRMRAATRVVDEFTAALHRQTDALHTLVDAHERVGGATTTAKASASVPPFIQSERGGAILKEIDGDD